MSRYDKIERVHVEGTRRQLTTTYPNIPYSVDDYYVITTGGDRFDLLAQEYYKNSTYWWIIATANPHVSRKDFVIEQGVQLRIPSNIEEILREYTSKNAQNTL